MAVLPVWQRKGLYYAPNDTFGGVSGGDTVPDADVALKVLENTGKIPTGYNTKAIGENRTGRGVIFPTIGDRFQGRMGLSSWPLECDLTTTIWRDMIILLLKSTSNVTLVSTYYKITEPTVAEVTNWGVFYQFLTASAHTFTGYYAESCAPKSITFTQPMSEPDSEGSVCTLGFDLVGRSRGEMNTFPTFGTTNEDTAAKILGHEPLWNVGGTVDTAGDGFTDGTDFNCLEASLTIDTGLWASAECNSDDLTPRLLRGDLSGSGGTIKVFVEAATSAASLLFASKENKTVTSLGCLIGTSTAFQVSIMVMDVSEPEEVDGGQVMTFTYDVVTADTGADVFEFWTLKASGGTADSAWPTA